MRYRKQIGNYVIELPSLDADALWGVRMAGAEPPYISQHATQEAAEAAAARYQQGDERRAR